MRRRKKSSAVAKDRLKLVLIYDRAGTGSNNDMLEMLRRDLFEVLSKYIEIDESEVELNIKTMQNIEEGQTSELTACFPIRQVNTLGRNRH